VSISAGFSPTEIRELVVEYQLLPYGQKGPWLAASGVTNGQFRRWQAAVFSGDLDRGLIPREGSYVSTPPVKRTAIAKARAAEAARHDAELARLQARVDELEQTNAALGKAIGLLHARSELEPDTTPMTNDPDSSSTSKTHSSPS
jgi:hypothetical protein